MPWESDLTEGAGSGPRWRGCRTLIAALLAGVLLGSAFRVWYLEHPSRSPREYAAAPSLMVQAGSIPAPIRPLVGPPLTTAADVPPAPFDLLVQPTAATITIMLPSPSSGLRDDIARTIARPTYRWRVLIPAGWPAYYALGVTLEVRARGDAIAGPATLWYHDGRTARLVPDPAVTVTMHAGRLVLMMSEPALIAQVFAQHPPIVTVEGVTPEALPLTTVVVRYKTSP